ncbi:transformation/transcription domain-associated protein-like isoform X2 [Oscarella lobularis]|uniref:transformation/transcription domain-associated protein-like isoform X2 n=1 Tax=Oscarella lobularis TaxID=121494 RepID=UPI003313E5EB
MAARRASDGGGSIGSGGQHAVLASKFRNYIVIISEPGHEVEAKIRAAQELSENFDNIVTSPQHATFLEQAVPRFLAFLREGEPSFIVESLNHQIRKLLLEIIHRIPVSDLLKPYAKGILNVMFRLLETENEENVLVCLKIIIELHKQLRPPFQIEVRQFLQFVQTIYRDLSTAMQAQLEGGPVKVEPGAVVIGQCPVEVEQGKHGIPKGTNSLKVLAELPIIVVLMYQLYKQQVHATVAEFIPLIINIIVLGPNTTAQLSSVSKETYIDFVGAQIKTLSFLAYVIKIYQDVVKVYAPSMVQGMLSLLKNCPPEVAYLRKELLIAARHILPTDFRNQFVPQIDKLLDEDTLIGTGWTTRESLRPLAYSTLADLVHHVRGHLSLQQLALAVDMFAKNVNDETLPVSIQTMSCKLLLNLVECIRQKSDPDGNGRDILIQMLEVFVQKFQTIAKYQIPAIFSKCVRQNPDGSIPESEPPKTPATMLATTPGLPAPSLLTPTASGLRLPGQTLPGNAGNAVSASLFPGGNVLSASDCRILVKTLVCGVKTITWGAGSCKAPGVLQKTFFPRETPVFVRLLKYTLLCLDIYQVMTAPNGSFYLRPATCQTVKMREEKEILEHFAGVFTMMNLTTFKEVFGRMIEYLVERIHNNYALQIIPNTFLANPNTSATFATVMIHFLLEKMEEMGVDIERSNLYLKLFKLVFGSVSLFAQENEQMLKPHLHEIVTRSMDLAKSAKEPYNYFLLLRALFRSIGGGSHDLLYQEFLPLLPNLLRGLNRLQSSLHRQQMKDLFVELCLTVPVRLSSLLPYLPMLMDPLVSALNGSQPLISQGLRTLELCVDNLQPDFLYDHIQPVRAELMQALWRQLRSPSDTIAQVAFRVLGKFGGGNRKMLCEPQELKYSDDNGSGPGVGLYFPESSNPIIFPIASVVENAVSVLRLPNVGLHTRQQAWCVVKSYIISSMDLTDSEEDLHACLLHFNVPSEFSSSTSKPITPSRRLFKRALEGMLIASTIKELQPETSPFVLGTVRHIAFIAVIQENEPSSGARLNSDVLMEAIATVMSSDDKDLAGVGVDALNGLLDAVTAVVRSRDVAARLPLVGTLCEKLCGCCYERAWYSKAGGCQAIMWMMEKLPLVWLLDRQIVFVSALLFVMMDLSGEVSSGTVDMARQLLEDLLRKCNPPIENDEETKSVQLLAFGQVTQRLVKEMVAQNKIVRKEAYHLLSVLSEVTGKSVPEIMQPHKSILADMIPPKKHFLRHQPVNTQLGLMDGFTFCTTLKPRLFSLDLSIKEHQIFYQELLFICESSDTQLQALPCYKNVVSLTPLRKSGLAALAACNYISDCRKKIFKVLYEALYSNTSEVALAAEESMKRFIDGQTIDPELVHESIKRELQNLASSANLTPEFMEKLNRFTGLFSYCFKETLCDTLLSHLKKWMEAVIINATSMGPRRNGESREVRICTAIIHTLHLIPVASFKLFEPVLAAVLSGEKALSFEMGSPFRDPLFKMALRYPEQAVDYILGRLADPPTNRLFAHWLTKDKAESLRSYIELNPKKLIHCTFRSPNQTGESAAVHQERVAELIYQGILITSILVKHNDQWLAKPEQRDLVNCLSAVWRSPEFQQRTLMNQVVHRWKEAKLLVKCLLSYIKYHREDVELLFELLRVFTKRYMPSFLFFKDFLDREVALKYSPEERRFVFYQFVKFFENKDFPEELKAKALQHVLIPTFTASFAKGEKEKLLGGSPNPDQDRDGDIISVFIARVIDADNPLATTDALRILLLQFSALLVEKAPEYIHDPANKLQKQGSRLRRLTAYAWPCLLPRQCEDPAARYHGHLLLAHIIAKFAIHKKIVLQVFVSLLKAHAVEARGVIRQALEVLTPAIQARMDDGNTVLMHWTKKIIVEEGHTVAQLVHILQLLVRHYKVYYPVRGYLIQYMISSMQKLGYPPTATIEQRRLAVDLAEVIIKWEMQRIKEQQIDASEGDRASSRDGSPATTAAGIKRSGEEMASEAKRAKLATAVHGRPSGSGIDSRYSLEKSHLDAVANFLVRIACQVNEPTAQSTGSSPGELLSRRCLALLKTALKDVWPNADMKVAWFDKLLCTVIMPPTAQPEPVPAVNYSNVCTALEVLTFIMSVMPRPIVLATLKPLQRGISSCMSSQNTKVIRAISSLLTKLVSIFPAESSSSSAASKYEELDGLYASISRVVYDGLHTYEKSAVSGNAVTMALYGTLMILKAVCSHNPSYIDRFAPVFVKALMKMQRDHLAGTDEAASSPVMIDMLILGLEILKTRVITLSQEMRKNFIALLSSLIEKSPDIKLLKAVTKIVDEWVKQKSQLHVQQAPSLREKSALLFRMMSFYEKRFPNEQELNAQFLEIVNFVYRDESLQGSDLTGKLEPAFLAGLRCSQPTVRAKFFEIFNTSIKRKLYDRLLYVVCSQNWEFMGNHFWIKQCIELLLALATWDRPIGSCYGFAQLPAITAKPEKKETKEIDWELYGKRLKVDSTEREDGNKRLSESMEIELKNDASSSKALKLMITEHIKYLQGLRSIQTSSLMAGVIQLCHTDTDLAYRVWIHLFPRLWDLLSEGQKLTVSGEISPFLCSGSHLTQVDCHPSAVKAFLESVSRCKPHISLRPAILKYLGKTHNAWHRTTLLLEEHAHACDYLSPKLQAQAQQQHRLLRTGAIAEHQITDEDLLGTARQETLDSLSELYSLLREEDTWAGLWHQRCRFSETSAAILNEQHGLFEQAQLGYEKAMGVAKEESAHGSSHPAAFPEYRLWRERWIRCCKELGQWNVLVEFGKSRTSPNPLLVLETAWKIPDWPAMKDALNQVEMSSPETFAYKLQIFRGYMAISHPDDQHMPTVQKVVEASTNQAIKQWKRLPAIVAHVHVPLLQAAQQVMELQEAGQMHNVLLPANIGRAASLHDVKAIVKTWRNRLPNLWDDLSHWSDIFLWRQHHYQTVVSAYDQAAATPETNHAMLGVHASAWAIIHHAYVARKHDLCNVCLDNLSRIHTIPSVPIVDCFQKIKQQVKCYLQIASSGGRQDLQEGLDLIESTNLKFFTKEMTAEVFTQKGTFLAQMGRSDEANKCFSSAVQLNDNLSEAWGQWGDYLDQIFTKDRKKDVGASALTCYLHACRQNDEVKTRKYLSRVIWLLAFDDESKSLAEVVDKYATTVPPNLWLPWIPQLLTCLVRKEGKQMLNLLFTIGRVFPQAVYFPIRTLYLTLKIEHSEKFKSELSGSQPLTSTSPSFGLLGSSSTFDLGEDSKEGGGGAEAMEVEESNSDKKDEKGGDQDEEKESSSSSTSSSQAPKFSFDSSGVAAPSETPGPLKATAAMWRCSRIMHLLRELHPTLLSALEAIVDQMIWFRENWCEEVLRQLKHTLARCQTLAFENSNNVSDAQTTPQLQNFLRKLISTFGLGFESSSSISSTLSSAASESLTKRRLATSQDPLFQKLKAKFSHDFDFSSPNSARLHNLIGKLKKWIKILEGEIALLPKSFLLEEKCRFLSNFSLSNTEVELPGEFLSPKPTSYCIKIARFMPRVEIVKKCGISARRLFILGHNGKVYPYLVTNDACLTDSRREERVLQLCRAMNIYFSKRKESCKRNLVFYVPKVVAVSPQMRLVEDNPSSICLLDVYKQYCKQHDLEPDAPVTRFYERLAAAQARGGQVSQAVLRDTFKEVQSNMIPSTVLKNWAVSTYQDATYYWAFRKQFTLQIALGAFLEYGMHLTRLGPEMLYVARDTGQVAFSYYRFDVNDTTGELDANRAVSFRLTPNMVELASRIGVVGPFTSAVIAASRCAVQPQFSLSGIVKTILCDEVIAWHKRQSEESGQTKPELDSDTLIKMVNQASSAIMSRLQGFAQFEGGESKVNKHVAAASHVDNLCRMDPAWHPWL